MVLTHSLHSPKSLVPVLPKLLIAHGEIRFKELCHGAVHIFSETVEIV